MKKVRIDGKTYSMPNWLADTLHWWIVAGTVLTTGLFIVGFGMLLGGMSC